MVRELKESLLPWLSGHVLPQHPTLTDYDGLARRWIQEVVLIRRHRTTQRIVGEAWAEERLLLAPVPAHLVGRLAMAPLLAPTRPRIIDLEQRRQGEHVQVRDLAESAAMVR